MNPTQLHFLLTGHVEGGRRDVILLVARVLLASLFLISGFDKVTNLPAATAFMATTRAPLPELLAAIAAAIELGGGSSMLFGVGTRITAIFYIVYVPVTALIGHPYWTVTGAAHDNMLFHFWKNIALTGGFLLLLLEGPGRFSIDWMFGMGLRDLHEGTNNRKLHPATMRRG